MDTFENYEARLRWKDETCSQCGAWPKQPCSMGCPVRVYRVVNSAVAGRACPACGSVGRHANDCTEAQHHEAEEREPRGAAVKIVVWDQDSANFTSAEDVLYWLSGCGGRPGCPTPENVRAAVESAVSDIKRRVNDAGADAYEAASRERDAASAALLTEQDKNAALRASLTRLIDAAVPHVGAEYPTDEETIALRHAIKNAREDMR